MLNRLFSGLSRHLRVARGTYAAKDLTELEMIRLQPNPDIIEENNDDGGNDEEEEEKEAEVTKEEGEKEAEEDEEKDEEAAEGQEVGVTVADDDDDETPQGPVHRRNCDGCGVSSYLSPISYWP